MADRTTPNLPSRDFGATAQFYGRLGFACDYRDADWMILRRGPLEVEFFAHPECDPRTSWFSACIRTDDLDGLYTDFRRAGLPDDAGAIPRLTAPVHRPPVDADGSLWRCLENGG